MLFNLCINRPLFLGFLRVKVQETRNSGGADSCYRNVVFAHSTPVHPHVLSLCFLFFHILKFARMYGSE